MIAIVQIYPTLPNKFLENFPNIRKSYNLLNLILYKRKFDQLGKKNIDQFIGGFLSLILHFFVHFEN